MIFAFQGVSVVLRYASVDMKIVLNLLKSKEPAKNRQMV